MPSTVAELQTFEVRQQRVLRKFVALAQSTSVEVRQQRALRRSVVAPGPSTSESGLKLMEQRIAAGLDRWRRKPSVWQERLGLCCC